MADQSIVTTGFQPETLGLDSMEYKASTKDVGFKIYGDFDTEEGRKNVEDKMNYIINLRIRTMASLGLPIPGGMAKLPDRDWQG